MLSTLSSHQFKKKKSYACRTRWCSGWLLWWLFDFETIQDDSQRFRSENKFCSIGIFAHVTNPDLVLLQPFIPIQNKTNTVVAGVLEVKLFLCREFWWENLALILGYISYFYQYTIFNTCHYVHLRSSREKLVVGNYDLSEQNFWRSSSDSVTHLLGCLMGAEINFKCNNKGVHLNALNRCCWDFGVQDIKLTLR